MTEQPAGATPGQDRAIQFFVRGGEFRLRRPTRGDQAEILRRYTAKLMRACPPFGDLASQEVAKETLNGIDGGNLLTEARLEVLLLPRPDATPYAERAPSHWLRQLKDPDGKVVATTISFDDVDTEEFDEVARFVDEALAKKKAESPTATSTDTAPGATKD